MPKPALSPAQKQALSVQWIQQSGVAHTLKDLEKALPSVTSISSMHIKDHIQSLVDENFIRVEKIGSGNWYWSFPSDEKVKRETALTKAEAERDKAQATLDELRTKVEEATAKVDKDEMFSEPGMDRKSLIEAHDQLNKGLEGLRKELAAYSENDPVEIERRKGKTLQERAVLEDLTDQIYSMEGWFKRQMAGDKEQFMALKKNWYGDEFDEETGGLKDI